MAVMPTALGEYGSQEQQSRMTGRTVLEEKEASTIKRNCQDPLSVEEMNTTTPRAGGDETPMPNGDGQNTLWQPISGPPATIAPILPGWVCRIQSRGYLPNSRDANQTVNTALIFICSNIAKFKKSIIPLAGNSPRPSANNVRPLGDILLSSSERHL